MKRERDCWLVLGFMFGCVGGLRAQATSAVSGEAEGGVTASATTNDAGPAGIIPMAKGFNVSLGTSSQHDSSNGWSSVLTPDGAYRLNRIFSFDVTVPIYDYINVEDNTGTKLKPVYSLVNKRFVLGDTPLSAHVDLNLRSVEYNGTVTLGLPSGNSNYGLGAGQVTYNFNNHFEKGLGSFTPDVEMGIGDSSSLINARVRKAYLTVGPIAHFQLGGTVDLPLNMSFEANAYEELPLGSETTYSTTGRGKKKVTTATNSGPAEDNGFLTSLDIPVNRHVVLSGFYNRSLRDKVDTGGFSLTFLLRGAPKER